MALPHPPLAAASIVTEARSAAGRNRRAPRGPANARADAEVVGVLHLKSDITLSVGVNSVVGGPGRPAPAGHVAGVGGEASDGLERPSQEELDLGRRAAKLVGSPAGEGVVNSRVDAEEDVLAVPHGAGPAGMFRGRWRWLGDRFGRGGGRRLSLCACGGRHLRRQPNRILISGFGTGALR